MRVLYPTSEALGPKEQPGAAYNESRPTNYSDPCSRALDFGQNAVIGWPSVGF